MCVSKYGTARPRTTRKVIIHATLFVVRSRFTRTGTARRAFELLYNRQARILGLIYNRANANSSDYECYKYAEYSKKPKKA